MGVLINGYLEASDSAGWRFAGGTIPNPDRGDRPGEPELVPEPFFQSFHKELAAILVGHGRPIRSAEPYTPVVPKRGLPADLSPELAAYLKLFEREDWFEASWFTGRELLTFDWTSRSMRRTAMVDERVAHLFADGRRGFPFAEWPAGIPIQIAGQSRDGVRVEWVELYAEVVRDFYSDVLPRVAALERPDDVRVVVTASW